MPDKWQKTFPLHWSNKVYIAIEGNFIEFTFYEGRWKAWKLGSILYAAFKKTNLKIFVEAEEDKDIEIIEKPESKAKRHTDCPPAGECPSKVIVTDEEEEAAESQEEDLVPKALKPKPKLRVVNSL